MSVEETAEKIAVLARTIHSLLEARDVASWRELPDEDQDIIQRKEQELWPGLAPDFLNLLLPLAPRVLAGEEIAPIIQDELWRELSFDMRICAKAIAKANSLAETWWAEGIDPGPIPPQRSGF